MAIIGKWRLTRLWYRIWTVSPSGCRGEYEDFTVYVNPIPSPTIEDGSLCIDDLGNVFQTYWLQATGNYPVQAIMSLFGTMQTMQ
ncbi:hypothetical protein [Flavobacterium sp.]|uniref:hypothetical protein n=1 Tax=Flavobacterium sp. TaxID=239 RepID=UPI003527FA7B